MISIFSIFECLAAVATWIAMQRRSNIVRHFNHRFTSTSDDLDPESTSCLDGPALKCQDKLSADLTQKVMVKMAPDSDCSIPTKRFKHQPWHQKDGIKKSYPQNYSTISNLQNPSDVWETEAARGEKVVGEVPLRNVESEGSGSCEGGALP